MKQRLLAGVSVLRPLRGPTRDETIARFHLPTRSRQRLPCCLCGRPTRAANAYHGACAEKVRPFPCRRCGDWTTNSFWKLCATCKPIVIACKVCGKPSLPYGTPYCAAHEAGRRRSYQAMKEVRKSLAQLPACCGLCQTCGAAAQVRHHPNYDEPQRVVFLCRSCHNKIHSGPRGSWRGPQSRIRP